MNPPPLAPLARPEPSAAEAARFVRSRLPAGGLFAGQEWRISPEPFRLGAPLAKELESLGRVLLQFYRCVNLLYRQSWSGRQPDWIARLLDLGKDPEIIQWQRHPALKNDWPRVIRPDILLTDDGLSIIELDSVPGGIGLTAWLNQTYQLLGHEVIGGPSGMITGFAGIFGPSPLVHLVVSEEAAGYRPEMAWLSQEATPGRFALRDPAFTDFKTGEAVYRFFELFDWKNVPSARRMFDLSAEKLLRVTPPPKPIFEEKLLFALLWNRNLREFWRQELGEGFFQRLLRLVPYSWTVDPAPLPPHGAIPELNLTDWQQLKTFSQKERALILKISGYSEKAWGARGVHLGSDLPAAAWSSAVDEALASFPHGPYILQRYEKPRLEEARWFDFETGSLNPMPARVRLCPYYFVEGEGDGARARLCGILATLVPQEKKIVHGMKEAILAPCIV